MQKVYLDEGGYQTIPFTEEVDTTNAYHDTQSINIDLSDTQDWLVRCDKMTRDRPNDVMRASSDHHRVGSRYDNRTLPKMHISS